MREVSYNKLFEKLKRENFKAWRLPSKVEISPITITNLRNNKANIKLETILKICNALDYELEEVVEFIKTTREHDK